MEIDAAVAEIEEVVVVVVEAAFATTAMKLVTLPENAPPAVVVAAAVVDRDAQVVVVAAARSATTAVNVDTLPGNAPRVTDVQVEDQEDQDVVEAMTVNATTAERLDTFPVTALRDRADVVVAAAVAADLANATSVGKRDIWPAIAPTKINFILYSCHEGLRVAPRHVQREHHGWAYSV